MPAPWAESSDSPARSLARCRRSGGPGRHGTRRAPVRACSPRQVRLFPYRTSHPPLRSPFPSAAVRPFPNELPTNPEIRFRRNGRSESLSLTLVAERYGSRAIHDAYVSALQIAVPSGNKPWLGWTPKTHANADATQQRNSNKAAIKRRGARKRGSHEFDRSGSR